MTLQKAIGQFIEWRRAHGAKYQQNAGILRRFLKTVDGAASCDAITTAQVLGFLAGDGPLTRYRENKYSALAVFYRYAVSRGFATHSPLPDNEPKPPLRRRPYIYTHDELQRLFGAIEVARRGEYALDAETFRTLLFVLYGAGLRVGEARRLTLADVDLQDRVISVHDTKFFKSRLVPISPQLTTVLKKYASVRANRPFPQGDKSFFLVNRNGTPVARSIVGEAFRKLCTAAGIKTTDNTRRPPCLHAFRHSFAVHRLTSWYREGADVQRLLPVLSTYLGHSDLEGTKVYLSMTPELLQQASLCFARYVGGQNA